MGHEWMDEERRTVREFAAWMELTGLSQTGAARLLRVSAATMSQCLSATYAGRADRVCEAMTRELRRARLRAAAPEPPPYATTSVTEDVIRAIAIAHTERAVVLILGPTGVGKTEGIRRYCQAEPETILLTAGIGCSPWAITRDLADRFGQGWRGSVYHMRRIVAEHLAGTGRLIVVDEIDYVNEPTLQALRMIHDEARCGLVLVGTQAYLAKLRARKSATIRQVLGRIKHAVEVGRCSEADLAAILSPFGLSDEAMDAVVEGANGEARRAVGVVIAAKRAGGKAITVDAIHRAYETLMPVED